MVVERRYGTADRPGHGRQKADAGLFETDLVGRDDGRATFLSWSSDRAVPAILITDSEGTEGPVNFTVRGETIVVQAVPRQIVLRHGDESALLINNGPVRPSAPLRDEAALAQIEAEARESN